MSKMNRRDYAGMILSSPVDTVMIEFRTFSGHLIAACLMDRLVDGVSAVYSFFDPTETRRSLGSYIILWMIQETLRLNLKYVYLGYWVEGSPKMDYKVRFKPIEGFGTKGWELLKN